MGACNGCSVKEIVGPRESTIALMALESEPKGTKKTLAEMLGRTLFKQNPDLRQLAQEELDSMAKRRYMKIEDGNKYIFSKDSDGRYSWQPASKRDILRYHVRSLIGKIIYSSN